MLLEEARTGPCREFMTWQSNGAPERCLSWNLNLLTFKNFIYLFIINLEREEWREKARERNINVKERYQSVASCIHPNQGLNPQPSNVPWQGIELVTVGFAGHLSGPEMYFYPMFVISHSFHAIQLRPYKDKHIFLPFQGDKKCSLLNGISIPHSYPKFQVLLNKN